MSNPLQSLRAFARGTIDESTLVGQLTTEEEMTDLENDEELMAEVLEECLGAMVAMEVLGEQAELIDEATDDAFRQIASYMIGQGIISEAAGAGTIHFNPKQSYVHLSPRAYLEKLKSIIILTLARRKDSNDYKKYKIAVKLKRDNMEKMRKAFGATALRMAKKAYRAMKSHGKVNAVIDNARKQANTKGNAPKGNGNTRK